MLWKCLLAACLASLLSPALSYHISPEFSEHSTKLDYLRTVNRTFDAVLRGEFSGKCTACEIIVEGIQLLVRVNASQKEIMFVISKACIFLKIEDQRVCSFVTQEFGPEFIQVFSRLLLHPAWLCYAAIGPECGTPPPDDIFPFWNVTIPPNKPPRKPLVRPKPGLPTLRVVQLSDLHIDLMYQPNATKNCGEPLCCRDGKGETAEDRAGFWGSLKADCDIPVYTYENALKFIADELKPDIVFWTGDIPAHDVWDQSRADQLQHIQIAAQLLADYLPITPVYASLGNHESSPVDSFPPPGEVPEPFSNDWLNKFVQKVWSRWLPPDSLDTVGYAGYYAVQYSKNLRIISLNTQYCDNLNFWLYLNNTDPGGQLQWLVEELVWAETYNIKVIILGHIPTGRSDCFKAFSWNFYKIIDRFEATVVGQYMGHTHQDHYSILYSEEEDHHPTGFVFISPSVTTYSDQRPSIRVYTLDGVHANSTYRPLKTETYILDLELANSKNQTVWELEYTSDTAYNMTWLTPDTMQGLYERLASDRAFFNETYWKYKFHSRPEDPCDEECYKWSLCEIITGRSNDPSICKDLTLAEQHKWQEKQRMC